MTAPNPFDPFTALYCIEAISHVRRLPRIPRTTGTVVFATTVLHFIRNCFTTGRRRGLLSVYDYGLVPSWTLQKWGLTASMVVSPFLHTDLPHLITQMLPFLMSGATLENVLTRSTYVTLLSFAVVVPNAILVLLTNLTMHLPAITIQHKNTPPFHMNRKSTFSRRLHWGFSPALCCIQTVLNVAILSPQRVKVYLYGWPMNPMYSHWVELVLHQYLMPQNGSLVGRLCGILSGYVWLQMWQHQSWRRVLDGSGVQELFRGIQRRWYGGWRSVLRQSVQSSSGSSGGGATTTGTGTAGTTANVNANANTATIAGRASPSPANVAELRRRRLMRFNNSGRR